LLAALGAAALAGQQAVGLGIGHGFILARIGRRLPMAGQENSTQWREDAKKD
jgi:hypothetical protein